MKNVKKHNKLSKYSRKESKSQIPADFMFILKGEEYESLRCQFGTSSWGGRLKVVFDAIRQMLKEEEKPKKRIGFIVNE